MPDPLEAELNLSTDSALSAVNDLADTLSTSLVAALDDFEAAFTSIVSGLPPVDVTADASEVTPEVDAALAAVDSQVPVEATGEEEITAAISQSVAAADATVVVDADTAPADAAVQDLGSEISDVGSEATGAGGGISGLSDSTAVLAGSAGLATGQMGGLREITEGVSSSAKNVLGPVAAVGAGIGVLAQMGVDATSAAQRFNTILGAQAEAVNHIQLGSLDTSLEKLSRDFGVTTTEMQNTIATLYQFAINGGASATQATHFSQEIYTLAARAVALNPALGSVDSVAQGLELRFARGGARLAQYGITLSQGEIAAKAMGDAHVTATSDLTLFDKATAGADLAVQKYGPDLAKNIADGANNAAIQQRALTAEIKNALEEMAKPLVPGFLATIQASVPVITSFGQILTQVGAVALPALAAVLTVIGPLIAPVTEGFIAFYVAGTVLPAMFGLISTGLLSVAAAAPIAGEEILGVGIAVETTSSMIEAAAGPIGVIVAIAGIAATALGGFGGQAINAGNEIQKLTADIDKLNAVQAAQRFTQIATMAALQDGTRVLDSFRKVAEDNATAAQKIVDGMKAEGASAAELRPYQEAITKATQDQAKAKADSAAASNELNTSNIALADGTTLVTGSMSAQDQALLGLAIATGIAKTGTDSMTTAQQQEATALQSTLKAQDDLANAQSGAFGAATGYAQAVQQQADAQAKYDQALRDHGPASAEAAAANIALQQANEGVAQAAIHNDQAQTDLATKLDGMSGPALEQQLRYYQNLQAAYPAAAASLQPYLDQVQAAIDKNNNPAINSTHTSTLHVDDSDAAGKVDHITQGYDTIGKGVTGFVHIVASALGLQHGGPVSTGMPYVVGEAGPELFVPSAPGKIVPNGQFQASSVRSGAAGQGAPMIGVAYIGEQSVIGDLDYWYKSRMSGV